VRSMDREMRVGSLRETLSCVQRGCFARFWVLRRKEGGIRLA
jgi:hypothetical protein